MPLNTGGTQFITMGPLPLRAVELGRHTVVTVVVRGGQFSYGRSKPDFILLDFILLDCRKNWDFQFCSGRPQLDEDPDVEFRILSC